MLKKARKKLNDLSYEQYKVVVAITVALIIGTDLALKSLGVSTIIKTIIWALMGIGLMIVLGVLYGVALLLGYSTSFINGLAVRVGVFFGGIFVIVLITTIFGNEKNRFLFG